MDRRGEYAFLKETIEPAPVLDFAARKGTRERTMFPLDNRPSHHDRRRSMHLARRNFANRGLNLIYSKADDCCFVVVQDTGNHAVVTVLPLWMWNNGTLLESSSQAEEARRLALEPQPPRRDGKRMRRQPQRPGGLFGRRR